MADAQPASPPQERALLAKLQSEITNGMQCSVDRETLKDQLAAEQTKVKELEIKLSEAKKAE